MKKHFFLFSFLCVAHIFFAQKTNIVFILADDLGYGDLGCFGSKIIKTPHLDKLATEGIKLTQFYSGSTVCAPSRAALMTGKHTGHGYIRGNAEISFRTEDVVLPQLLKKAGYNTAMFGKWGLGDINTPGSPELKGWDAFFGYMHHVEAHYQAPGIVWQYTKEMKQPERIRLGGYGCDHFAEKAVNYIKTQSNEKPFFLYLALTIPHAELYAPDGAMKRYQNEKGNSLFDEKPWDGSHYGGQRMPKAAYAAMVSKADDYVGQVVKALKDKGIYEQTLIVFSSDNGTHIEGGRTKEDVAFMNSSGGLRGIKRDMTEGGIRVPTIIAGAGLPKNVIREGYGAFWDFLPTFLDLAAVTKPSDIDGISQLNYWKTGENWTSRPLYWEFFEGGFFQAVRQDNWKYIKSILKNGELKEELYDLKTDLVESNNLAQTNPQQWKIMAELSQKLRTKSENIAFRMPDEGDIKQPSTKGLTGKRDTSYTTFKAFKDIKKSHPNVPISWVLDKTPPSVKEQRNVTFASIGDRNLQLDAFFPKKKTKKARPAILIIHGGGWRTGNRSQHIPLAQHLAALGYVCFTAEYRLSTEALFPAAVHDLKAAIRWMRANAKTYHLDTNHIATVGFSAGGQLSALLANTGDNPKLEGAVGVLGHSSKVNAIIDIDGILAFIHPESGEGDDSRSTSAATYWFGFSKTENPDVWREGSALTYTNAQTPPTLFINSSVDRMHAGRTDYLKILDNHKVYSEVHTLPDSPHSFCLFNPWFDTTVKYIDAFLKKL